MKIPLVDLKAQYETIKEEADKAVFDVIENNSFILGKDVIEFEKNFSDFCGSKHTIGLKSGTISLFMALKCKGIKAGDEVITVPNTFIATTEAITLTGASIKFVDIDPKTYNMDIQKLSPAISPKTKAIIPVHLYGHPCKMDEIMEIAAKNNLIVVEDACQAHGAKYKGKGLPAGKIGCFSFYPGKNLGAYGDAGAIVTDDEDLNTMARAMRDHGRLPKEKYSHSFEGMNERMDALQASVLDLKLMHLQDWIKRRRDNAGIYNEMLKGIVETPFESENTEHSYHLYVIKTDDRDKLKDNLNLKGISAGIHYPVPLHLQPAYGYLGLKKGSFPETEKASLHILSLPMYPELTEKQIRFICEEIKNFFKH